MAMTADGKTASEDRRLSSFGSPLDHENLYALRATVDAILCGARTLDQDPVLLDAGPERFIRRRRRLGLGGQPIRVIASGTASISPNAAVFGPGESPLILITSRSAARARIERLRPKLDDLASFGDGEIDWGQALEWLYSEWGVRRLLVEGGGTLNDALFRADKVDELNLTLCPLLIGGAGASTIADGLGFPDLDRAALFRLSRFRRAGAELFLTYKRRSH